MKRILLCSALLLSLLTGCGGGGGNPGTCQGSAEVCQPAAAAVPSPAPDPGSTPTPAGAVIPPIPTQAPSELAGICTPEGEKTWVRAHLDDVYLWYKDIVDVAPSRYATPADYFYALLVRPKDRFSFTDSQANLDSFFGSGEIFGYGMELVLDNNRLRVAYVQPESVAAAAGIGRGAEIVSINGTPIGQLSRDVQVAALYPTQSGVANRFGILDAGAAAARDVTLNAGTVVTSPVQQVSVFTAGGRRFGYAVFNDHVRSAEVPLIAAFESFRQAGVEDVVLDLRYNGGGYLFIASEVGSMIGGSAVTGRVFEQLRYNDKHPEKTADPGNSIPFYTASTTGIFLPQLNLKRVFILTGNGTCSASESIINSLSPFVQVITIGSSTCGKPYGMRQTNNCGQAYMAIEFEGVNALGQGGYVNGIAPTCAAADDLEHPLGDTGERMLSTAIAYANGGGCPAASSKQAVRGAASATVPWYRAPWRENRIVR